MKKYLIVFVIAVSGFLSLWSTNTINANNAPQVLYSHQSVDELREQFKKEKPTIFFDFHDVLVYQDRQTTLEALRTFGQATPGILGKIKLSAQILTLSLDPRFYWGLWQLLHMPHCAGHTSMVGMYFNMIGNLGYRTLRNELMKYSNNIFRVDPGMLAVVKALKDNGCSVRLFSNIEPEVWQDAKDRNLFPEIFELFPTNTINSEPAVTYECYKPLKQAYDAALMEAQCIPQNAVMIEDNPKNIPGFYQLKKHKEALHQDGVCPFQPTPWAAGFIYKNRQQYQAFVAALKSVGLLPETFGQE